jgi:hypothetical protein
LPSVLVGTTIYLPGIRSMVAGIATGTGARVAGALIGSGLNSQVNDLAVIQASYGPKLSLKCAMASAARSD